MKSLCTPSLSHEDEPLTNLRSYPCDPVQAEQKGFNDYPCSIYANPFPENTVEFRKWVDGWVSGVKREDFLGVLADFKWPDIDLSKVDFK